MAIDSHLTDQKTGETVRVVGGGALAVSPAYPSLAFNATLETDSTAVNIVPAKADNVFRITGLLLTANQNVSNTVSATISIYTGAAEDTAVGSAIKTLFSIPLGRNDTRDITGILLETGVGQWINGETTDDDVFVTVLGHYLEVLE
jgi:hypothetical protein